MAKAPEIGLFGAALPPGAEVQHSDEETAMYRAKARIDDVIAFYKAVYGKTAGLEIVATTEPPANITITRGPKCEDAEFDLITAVAVPKDDRAVDVIVTKRGPEDDEEYPDSSPWKTGPGA